MKSPQPESNLKVPDLTGSGSAKHLAGEQHSIRYKIAKILVDIFFVYTVIAITKPLL
jgi:hypothetical protein